MQLRQHSQGESMPRTKSGKWSVGLGVALVVLLALSLLLAAAIGGDPAIIAANPLLSILSVTLSVMVTLAGPLSLLVGVFTIIKYKEWSVCKYLAVSYGLALLMFMLGEFLFPQ